MHKALFLIPAFLFSEFTFSQAPVILKEETIGGSGLEYLYSLCLSPDGSILLAGHSKSDISGDKTENGLGNDDYWVVKLDTDLNVIGQKTLGGNSYDQLYDAHPTPDGGYILGGISRSGAGIYKSEPNKGFDDIWIVKMDADLNIEWENSIGGLSIEYLYSLELTQDGGYLLGATSISPISGDKTEDDDYVPEIWLIKLNSDGDIVDEKTINTVEQTYLQCMTSTADGGYFLAAYSYSSAGLDKSEGNYGGTDIWILRLNSELEILYQNTIAGDQDDVAYSIKETTDGGCIFTGLTGSGSGPDKSEGSFGGSDIWTIKLTNTGAIDWENTLGGTKADIGFWAEETNEGNFIVASFSQSDTSDEKSENRIGDAYGDFWIFTLDTNGEVIWDKTIGGTKDDIPSDLIETGPGKYMIAGYSTSDANIFKNEDCIGNYDFWIMNIGPCNFNATINKSDVTCFGGSDGSAIIAPLADGDYSFEWNTSPAQFNDTAVNLSAGIYSVTATTYYGCAQTFSVEILQPDTFEIIGTDSISACYEIPFIVGDGLTITGGTAPYIFSWYDDGILISNDTTIIVSLTSDHDFTLQITDSIGCICFDTIHCTINPPEFAEAGPDTTICPGSSVILNGEGGIIYNWTPATFLNDSMISSPVCSPSTDINYQVIVINATGCADTAYVSINVLDLNTAIAGPDTTVCSGDHFELYASDGILFEWVPDLYLDNPFIQSPLCTPEENIMYNVFITDINGCVSNDSVSVSVNICDGIYNYANETVKLFPNPVIDLLTCIFPGNVLHTISIYDMTGKEITSFGSAAQELKVSVNFLPPGIYLIKFSNSNTETISHFIKL